MEDIYYQVLDQILLTTKETYYVFTLVPKKYHPYMFLKIKDALKESQYSEENKVLFVDTFSRRTHFWDTAVPCGSENNRHNVVQLNPNDDNYYLLTPYPTLMQPLKKFHQKASELSRPIQILIYNRSAYTLNSTFNTTYVHNNFKKYSQKRHNTTTIH